MSKENEEKERAEKEEFKVIDRRRFDADGKERNIEGSEESSGEQRKEAAPTKETQKRSESQQGASSSESFTLDFSSFVMSFATQALMQLGEIDPPAGVSIPKDSRAAQQTIDILSMLQEKTKGNLDQREATLIEDILHNLRITFIKATKG